MTLCNVWLEQDRALVAVDTTSLSHVGPYESSKLAILPHAHCVLTMRGSGWIFVQIVGSLIMAAGPIDHDSIADLIPAICNQCAANRPPQLVGWQAALELRVVGWSEQRKRMAASLFVINLEAGTCVRHDITRCQVAPAMNPVSSFGDLEGMMELSRKQVTANSGAPGFGGHLLVAELTPDSVTIKDAGKIVP